MGWSKIISPCSRAREFSEDLFTDNNKLFCKFCNIKLLQEWSLYCNFELIEIDYSNFQIFWEKMASTFPFLMINIEHSWEIPLTTYAFAIRTCENET
ncbi:hypothetical protein Glove_202g103 [Diversispora epigaea]|uniref:Uncharacterized protein n=1 Tax=Diversispora epigaea TaxID=1348612 RepID=A0A397IR24_9GLOM|nr:hypothetical protein Glove_202g103 [Diversispora epigaea]